MKKKYGLIIAFAIFTIAFVLTIDTPRISALNPNHNCADCHYMHQASGSPLLPYTSAENTCLSCHAPGGPSSLKAANHVGRTCMECHDPHDNVDNWLGGTNLKLVLAYVRGQNESSANRPVVFESRGTDVGDPSLHSFCDGDQDGNGVWDGVCDTCHNNTGKHEGYPVPSGHNHQQKNTCTRSTNCHSHQYGFKKK